MNNMTQSSDLKSFSIVIPAYNEEEAIGDTIGRCLAAVETIKARTPIRHVEIIVVSDGSSDRTAEIARSYRGIQVLAYTKNRGYGAAIKLGFSTGCGDLLGFLDADGTCDPEWFVDLINVAVTEQADVVLGSRLHKDSKMPWLRWAGNRMYSILVSHLGTHKITDTASGMRVLRSDALPKLYPLPDGLHFTPAMSCRAILQDGITLLEVPIPYHERLGRSKLKVLRDGIRFLHSILEIALTYRPLKFFGWAASVLFLLGFIYSLGPVHTYILRGVIPIHFIYRLIAVNAACLAGLILLTIGVVAERVAEVLNRSSHKRSLMERFLLKVCSTKAMLVAGIFPILAGVILNGGAVVEYLSTGHITYHWSYISMGSFLVLTGMQLEAMGMFELLLTRILQRNGHRKANGCAVDGVSSTPPGDPTSREGMHESEHHPPILQ
ncbi:MAG: glycosyltransferase family 2 protein [Syntrophobacteraceae bacterium]|nr:glycosyltransferase family 2 protein [Syntrophobacteraceae bacterium]